MSPWSSASRGGICLVLALIAVAVAALSLPGQVMAAQNPDDPGLRELWESYPLEERQAREQGTAANPDERARPSSSARISYPREADDAGSGWLLIAAPAALALVLAGTLALLHLRGRRSSTSGVALPRGMPERG